MAWLFVPELECSTKGSEPVAPTSDATIGLFVTSSGTATQRPPSWRGWQTRPWSRLLFGTTSRPCAAETGVASWIASLRASRASRGQRPAAAKERTTTAGCGPTSRESSETRNLRWCSSKTSPGLFPGVDYISFSTTLPKWGSMRNGAISRRKPWGSATNAIECSSWPTPNTAPDAPNGSLNRGDGQLRARETDQCLGRLASHWPTPDCNTASYSNGVMGPNIREAAALWATPAAHERATTPRELDHGIQLANQADDWATPNAGDAKSGEATGRDQRSLGQDVNCFTHRGRVIRDGRKLSKQTRTSRRRLNPAFVCWLMAWPWWWTRAEPISFAAVEMASYRSKLQQRLSYLLGV